MLIAAEVRLSFPRPLVYTTYRDHLLEVVPYLPNVQRIEVKSRRQEQGLIHLVNEWHGGGEIPPVARALISEAMLTWTDFAIWNETEFTTQWRIKTSVFTEAVDCAGLHRFHAVDGGTVVVTQGELKINPRQIKGVLPFLAQPVGSAVEDFLSQKITPNLLLMGEGVERYLSLTQTHHLN